MAARRVQAVNARLVSEGLAYHDAMEGQVGAQQHNDAVGAAFPWYCSPIPLGKVAGAPVPLGSAAGVAPSHGGRRDSPPP